MSYNMLEWLNSHDLIDKSQYVSGKNLVCDFELSSLPSRIRPDLRFPRGVIVQGSIAEIAFDARRRVVRALDAMGPGLSEIVVDICVKNKGLYECEHDRGWSRASAKVVLSIALTRLAKHYGLLIEGPAAAPMRRFQEESA